MRRAGLLALLPALAACPRPRPTPPPPPAPPRLVVLMVIDQLPAWSYAAKAAAASDGLATLAAEGRRWTARYPYAATQTAVGHAALATGAPPSVTGILANEWWHRDAGRELRAAEDPAGGSSATWLRVDGVADVLAREHPAAKAVGVALKDRSALLALGHAGLSVWYDDKCTCFVSNAAAPPAWLATLAADHPVAPRLAAPWVASDPALLARLSGSPDDAPGELAIPGWTATFPHDLAATGNAAKAVIDTPLGDELVAEAAIAAIRGEGLGADDVPDYLVVSFSAHDYVGHAFGQDSWEAWDTWLALDRQIGDVVRALDAEVGAGRWALVLTSDHGAPELPERREARGLPGARFPYEDVAAVAERAAAGVAGAGGPWIASARFPTIYLTAAALALPDATRRAVIDAAAAAVRAMPGIDRAEPSAALEGDCDCRRGDDRALCLSLDPERSGEIVYDPAEGTVLHKADWVDAVAHGSLHAYDREVPLVVVGPGVAPGDVPDVASPLQVAPTVARFLGISAPPAAEESPLRLR